MKAVASVTVPATPDFVRAAGQFVVQTSRHLGVAAADSPLFEVAVVEALANAVQHGSRGRPDAVITCEIERHGGGLSIRIYDEGEGFTPVARPLPAIDSSDVTAVPDSGYGVPIMQSVFQDIQAHRRDGRFCLELTLGAELPLT
ncbi:MAG: ATP-binding protein [Vicinamibacterales bacterium]